MSRTEYHPTPHPQERPAVQDPVRPDPDRSSDDVAPCPARAACVTDALAVQARALHRARAVAQAAPEVRRAKVEAARRALQEGTLTLDGQALAEKLLQTVRMERRHP